MTYRSVLATLLTASAMLVAPAPSHAATACVENNQLTFNPPLTANLQSGNVTASWQGTCADLPGLTPSHYAGSQTVGYFGSCGVVFIAEGGLLSVVIGGTVYVLVRSSVQVKVELLQPDFACPISSAHGSGVISQVP